MKFDTESIKCYIVNELRMPSRSSETGCTVNVEPSFFLLSIISTENHSLFVFTRDKNEFRKVTIQSYCMQGE